MTPCSALPTGTNARGCRVLDRPGVAAIPAPRQEMLFRPIVIDRVYLGAVVLEMPCLKPTRISLPHDQIP